MTSKIIVFLLLTCAYCEVRAYTNIEHIVVEKSPDKLLADTCILDFYAGVNKAEFGKSTIKELMGIFGSVDVKRRKVPFNLDMGGGYSIKTVSYPELGLEFEFSNKGKKLKKRTITKIILSENCPCKTKNGIGIGSSYSEITAASCLGSDGKYAGLRSTEFKAMKGKLSYVKDLPKGDLMFVWFIGEYKKRELDFVAERIMISYWENK